MTSATAPSRANRSIGHNKLQSTAPRADQPSSPVSLYECFTMRGLSDEVRTFAPSRSRGAQRRRRLDRAIRRWSQNHELAHTRVRGAVLVTLTTRARDPLVAQGQMRSFWAAVRHRWPGSQYFCWAELQERGAVHYHALWLNAPRLRRGVLPAWVDRTWALGRTQVRWRDRAWVERASMEYVLGYAKKMGQKRYQQEYDAMPRELRTFSSERLQFEPTELDAHRDRPMTIYVAAGDSSLKNVEAVVQVVGQVTHVALHRCELELRPRHQTRQRRR